jgi:hypothetical protein
METSTLSHNIEAECNNFDDGLTMLFKPEVILRQTTKELLSKQTSAIDCQMVPFLRASSHTTKAFIACPI